MGILVAVVVFLDVVASQPFPCDRQPPSFFFFFFFFSARANTTKARFTYFCARRSYALKTRDTSSKAPLIERTSLCDSENGLAREFAARCGGRWNGGTQRREKDGGAKDRD